MNINKICSQLRLKGKLESYEVINTGNINTTFKVVCVDKDSHYQYLLQRVNKNVFKNPDKVMENIINVTTYIENSKKATTLDILHFNTTNDDFAFTVDEVGDYWRCCQYLDCVCFNQTDDLYVIEQAGSAFGEFQYLLDGFNASILHESIPNFHNTKNRIKNLESAIDFCTGERKNNAKTEIEYMQNNTNKATILSDMLDGGELPLRVTHNDTKCNNVIFDKDTHKAIAVIDLDTIMSGLTAYDFGDGARSICSTTEEDEIDLTKVKFDLIKFESFTKGYLSKLSSVLTKKEIETLGISVYVLTYELASRFLEDYLNGDTYFKIAYKEHNLVRAKCQIALCKDIHDKLNDINKIINKYAKNDIR